MPRQPVPAADALVDEIFPVHNKGGIALLDYMGSDADIEKAARVSFIGAKEEDRTKQKRRGLIRYLMSHRHTTPFEMVEFKFWVKAPMFVWRQWIRHRTANVNEISGRYAELPADWYVPEPQFINMQSVSNKQGRSEKEVADAQFAADRFDHESERTFNWYDCRLESGMAKELARINLPLSTYTEAIWKIDLHNLFHFISLRAHSHAQYEIRAYTDPMIRMVKAVAPMAWEAFEDYVMNAVRFSRMELELLGDMLKGVDNIKDIEGLLSTSDGREYCGFSRSGGEAQEFLNKIHALMGEEGT